MRMGETRKSACAMAGHNYCQASEQPVSVPGFIDRMRAWGFRCRRTLMFKHCQAQHGKAWSFGSKAGN